MTDENSPPTTEPAKDVVPAVTDYFLTPLHETRVNAALDREFKRLKGLGLTDVFLATSEAIGTLYGAAQFFKVLGMKHIGMKIMRSIFDFMRKGVN